MELEYRYLSEHTRDKLKHELPEGGNYGYLHFYIDDEWVTDKNEKILLNRISNYHDIEGGPFLNVFIFMVNNEKYVIRTFGFSDETENVYTRYIITVCGERKDKNENEKQMLFQTIKQALVFYDKTNDRRDRENIGFQYAACMMTDEISERMDYETSVYDKDELERHAKVGKLLTYKREIKSAISAMKEGENSYIQKDVKSMTDIKEGYHAWYDGKDYAVYENSLDSLVISSSDSSAMNKGFIKIDAQKFLYEYVSDKYMYYRVVYIDEVERIYYATYYASYDGVECMIKHLPKETEKLEITPMNFVEENRLKELGFEQVKLGGMKSTFKSIKK